MNEETASRVGVQISKMLTAAYTKERGVHSETILGAAAALAGEFALRATEPVLPSSGWIESKPSRDLLFEGEARGKITMWSIIKVSAVRAALEAARAKGATTHLAIDQEIDLPEPTEVMRRVDGFSGSGIYPPLSIPPKHFPQEWSPNACPKFRAEILAIGARHDASPEDLALGIAFAIGFLINQTSRVLPPSIAATLALETMLGVARMAPLDKPREQAAQAMTQSPSASATDGRPSEVTGAERAAEEFDRTVMVAGDEIMNMIFKTLWDEGPKHPGTMISTPAALTAEFALRASEPIIPGPSWIYSEKATQFLFAGRERGELTLTNILEASVKIAGVQPTDLPNASDVHIRGTRAIGGLDFPPISVPQKHHPVDWPPNICPRFRKPVQDIGEKHKLSERRLAMALAFATGRMVVKLREVVLPVTGATLALEVMLGCARVSPLAKPITPDDVKGLKPN
jgi:hypothetical protein